ncbi:hypothetical protein JMA_20170 [Jeotgalibacillus malaysiensis]|uniref:Helicase Helix-turn-helix domain-containing protein n=1 Tax=Jeotgalibacillus malaysiensis TaxID=1508404 RepID=A0A0B5ATL1_9BACL|nr:helix-turn-helix domain-containing protein [Jeotgalibacillus malaysiensis]AJD91334.1 hypothetical protein JMA_20170 [Jeotgalibacillus malaysiensis]
MNYLDAIVLAGLDIIDGERTQSSIYHLLKGKKTSQTIQDAQLFGLSPLFQMYRTLKRPYYDHRIQQCKEKGLIREIEPLKFRLTSTGRTALDAYFSDRSFPVFLNGWKYHQITDVFWKRLTLTIQTGSNLIYSNHRFIPVTRDAEVQQWVKHTIRQHRDHLGDFTLKLHDELKNLLENSELPESPELLVGQFSGYNHIGLTNSQLAELFNCGTDELNTRFMNVLHFLFQEIESHPEQFPLLTNMMKTDEKSAIPFTKSTEESYQYLKNRLSIDQIAAVRRLKRSTIEDHVLEIALLDPRFSIDPFIDHSLSERIRTLHIKSSRLKFIKDQIPEADYFQIRLVLAKAERGEHVWKNYLKKNLDMIHSEAVKKKSSKPY